MCRGRPSGDARDNRGDPQATVSAPPTGRARGVDLRHPPPRNRYAPASSASPPEAPCSATGLVSTGTLRRARTWGGGVEPSSNKWSLPVADGATSLPGTAVEDGSYSATVRSGEEGSPRRPDRAVGGDRPARGDAKYGRSLLRRVPSGTGRRAVPSRGDRRVGIGAGVRLFATAANARQARAQRAAGRVDPATSSAVLAPRRASRRASRRGDADHSWERSPPLSVAVVRGPSMPISKETMP